MRSFSNQPVGDSHDLDPPGSGPWTASTAVGNFSLCNVFLINQSVTAMIWIHPGLDHGLPALRWGREKEEKQSVAQNQII